MQAREHPAVTNFRKYLRIASVHGVRADIDYDDCVTFVTALAAEIGLPCTVVRTEPDKPIVIVTQRGQNPDLPSVLLNSHMDVVAVYPEHWTHPPFDAFKDDDGNIYGRGAQDMKCVGIQYIETIREFRRRGLQLKRTVHVSFVPDEEIGGARGMAAFVRSDAYRNLNVGFSLDEGEPSDTDEYFLYNGERPAWEIRVTCRGVTGHGSYLYENTAAEKIRLVIDRFLDYRESQKRTLRANPELTIGRVTSVNLTVLSGGQQANVLPPSLSATFDVRLAVDTEHDRFENMIREWCEQAGEGVTYEFLTKDPKSEITRLDDGNPWWTAFKEECDKMRLTLNPRICAGGTDSRFLRNLGVPALGFSPINRTPILLHDHDEHLNERIFLRGLDIYYNIIKGLASV